MTSDVRSSHLGTARSRKRLAALGAVACAAGLTWAAIGIVGNGTERHEVAASTPGYASPVPARPSEATPAGGAPATPRQAPAPAGVTGPVGQVLADAPATGPVRIVTLARDAEGRLHTTVTLAPDRNHAAAAVAAARAVPGALVVSVDHRVTLADVDQPSLLGPTRAVAASRQAIAAVSNDTYRSSQWALDMLQAETAWGLQPASGQVVAVIDTGVDGTHPDLAGVVLPGIDELNQYPDGRTDPHGHGTHVAGIVAAVANNNLGVAGLAQGARIMPVRVLSADGSGWDSDVANGIIYAADHGATVLNLSLAGTQDDPNEDAAISYARSKGVVVVAAAGNQQQSGNPVEYPAASPGVIAVAATDQNNAAASFSESGADVAISAPGVSIASTYPWAMGGYAAMSGTSMASPYVAASAALVRAAAPTLTPDQVATAMTSTARDLGAPGRDDAYGSGLVNPVAALQAVQSGAVTLVPPGAPRALVATAGDQTATVTWTAPFDGGSAITGYTVVAAPGGATITTSGATTAILTGLTNGTTYTFTVRATNAVGTGVGSAASATPATTPGAPTGVTAAAGHEAVTVSWTAAPDNGSRITGYTVVAAPGGATATTSGATTATVTGLTDGTAYTFTVTATNGIGSGAASSASPPATPTRATDRLTAGQQLRPGDDLASANGQYQLVVQADGNLVVYAPGQRALWSTSTWGARGGSLTLQSDGNLVLSDAAGGVLWHSNTWGSPGARLVLQDDGNLVLYNQGGSAIWYTGWDRGAAAPHDTLFPQEQLTSRQRVVSANGRYSLLVQDDGNVVVYDSGRWALWSTHTWARPGIRLALQSDGNLVAYTASRYAAWSAATWGNGGTRLVMQNDGNLVLYAGSGRPLWSSIFGRAY